MSTPLLTLTWNDGEDGARITYNIETGEWNSDYDIEIVAQAYIELMRTMTHEVFLRGYGYTPYPIIDRLNALSRNLNYTIDGVDELVAYLHDRIDATKEFVVF